MPSTHVFPLIEHLWFAVPVFVFLEGIAIYTWQFRREPGAIWQCLLQACKGIWLFAMIMISQPIPASLRAQWICVAVAAVLVSTLLALRFLLDLSGYIKRLPRWFDRAWILLAGLVIAIVATNPWTGLFYRACSIEHGSLKSQFGILTWPLMLSAYWVVAITITLCVMWARSCVGLRRLYAWSFLLPDLISLMGHVLNYYFSSYLFEPLAGSLLLSSVITTYAFGRWRAYSIVPLAEQAAAHAMQDALLILDESGILVQLNSAARELFHALSIKEGESFSHLAERIPALRPFDQQSMQGEIETSWHPGAANSFHEVRSIPLVTSAGHLLGRVMIFHDVTRERRQHQHILEQQKALAILTERKRLSRELHDGPGQLWGFLAMQTKAAQKMLARGNSEQAAELLAQLQSVITDAHVDLRESITSLQTVVGEQTSLIDAIGQQLQWYREHCRLETALRLQTHWQPDALPPYVEEQILRIVQEALTNVRKSAAAKRVSIEIKALHENLLFRIEDDGAGFDPDKLVQSTGHHGLTIMRERASEIGASLSVRSRPGEGCTLELCLPVNPTMLVPVSAVRHDSAGA